MRTPNRSRLVAAASSAILIVGVGGGCAANLSFDSPSPLGSGVAGKTWQVPYFVDGPLYIPGTLGISTNNPLSWDFSAAAYGNNLQLAGSWWDSSSSASPSSGVYRGYARLYQDGVGWSSLGPNFAQIASDGTSGFSSVSVAAGPNGLFMANLFDGLSVAPLGGFGAQPFDGASAYYTGTGWQLAINNTVGTTQAFTRIPKPGTNVASTMDSLGRGYVFYTDLSGVYETEWGLANPTGVSSLTVNSLGTGAIDANTVLTARFDGVSQVCATSEPGAGSNQLVANCQDIACAGPFNFNGAGFSSITVIDTNVSGHDTATDGAGNIMAVYYKTFGGHRHVYASLGSLPVAPGTCPVSGTITPESWTTPIQLDQLSTIDGYFAPTANPTILWPQGARPGVAYVGSGRFLAVWIGMNTTSVPSSTQIYSILYDPANGGWQGPQSIPTPGSLQAVAGSYESYTKFPHPQSLTVFGNGAGNAGFAINDIITTDIPGVVSTGNSVYPEAAKVRSITLNRWQEDDGWVSNPPQSFGPLISGGAVLTPGVTCYNLIVNTSKGPQAASTSNGSSVASGDYLDCSHPPVGAILPSGDTVVLFQAQDNYPQVATAIPGTGVPGTGAPAGSTIPGNRRVAGIEFK